MMNRFISLPNYRYYDSESGVLEKSVGKPLRNYNIFGNSVQEGTPSPENPVEIQSVGDLITDTASEYCGKYAVPIIITGKNMFNISDFIEFYDPYMSYATEYDYYDEVNRECLRIYGGINAAGRALVYMENSFKENTAYTFSLDCYDVFWSNGFMGTFISFVYTDGTKDSLMPEYKREDKIWKHYSITSNPDKTVQGITVSYGTGMAYSYLKNIQIEEASTENFYEPYITPVQTDIYLDEPLRRVGDYADYVDFKGQKVIRNVKVLDNTGTKPISESLGTLETATEGNISLPPLKTFKGTSIISVEAEIQPSKVTLQYYKG